MIAERLPVDGIISVTLPVKKRSRKPPQIIHTGITPETLFDLLNLTKKKVEHLENEHYHCASFRQADQSAMKKIESKGQTVLNALLKIRETTDNALVSAYIDEVLVRIGYEPQQS